MKSICPHCEAEKDIVIKHDGAGTYAVCSTCGVEWTNSRNQYNKRGHVASEKCWCEPYQDSKEPSVWIHRQTQ